MHPSHHLPPTELSASALENEVVTLAGHLAAAQCRWLLLLAEFDARGAWGGPGMRSCAHWLTWRVGMSLRTAHEHLRVAHALTGLTIITAAFAAGRVSYSKVRALSRIATPATEQDLLDLALAGTASHVERIVRLTRQARAEPRHPRRELRWEYDEEGYLRFRGRLPAEAGARLIAAIDGIATRAHPAQERSAERTGGPPGEVESLATRRAEALASLVTGEESADRTTDVIVHISLDDPEQRGLEPSARIAGGPALPRNTAERLACTGRVRALITDRSRNPLYLGRTRRLVPKTVLAALRFRDHDRCRFPGCTHTRWLHAHHIRPWLLGGRTDIDNLVLLCPYHHRLVHDRRYRIRRRGTRLRFSRPNGQPIPEAGAAITGSATELIARNQPVPDDPLTPAWGGERLDPALILDRLLTEPGDRAA